MRIRLAGFSGMLVITMAMSSIAFFALTVIASELQDEFAISKLQIGLLGGVNTGIGGVFAPLGGRVSDRVGGRNAMAGVLLVSGATAILIAVSQTYMALLGAMALNGLAQALANPSTNKAIATGVLAPQRGVLTGVKQSGVQLAVFTAGFAMPLITSEFGWRAGLWMIAGLSFVALIGTRLITELPQSALATDERRTGLPPVRRMPTFVTQVAIYGFLLGAVGGGLGRFLPLFAEEAAGFSPADAGYVFGVGGLVAIPTRIAAGIMLDRGVPSRTMLVGLAVGGAVAIGSILMASEGASSFLWIGTVLAGMTLGSWNTAANLSMVREKRNAGRASGRLMLGFFFGNALGGPVVGWSIDTFDSYTPAWISSAALALLGAVVVARRASDSDR